MTNKQDAIRKVMEAIYEIYKQPSVSTNTSVSTSTSVSTVATGYPEMFKHDNGLGQSDFNSKMSNEVINSYQK